MGVIVVGVTMGLIVILMEVIERGVTVIVVGVTDLRESLSLSWESLLLESLS